MRDMFCGRRLCTFVGLAGKGQAAGGEAASKRERRRWQVTGRRRSVGQSVALERQSTERVHDLRRLDWPAGVKSLERKEKRQLGPRSSEGGDFHLCLPGEAAS